MDSLNQFKIVLRPNNQISVTRQRLAKKREVRYEKTQFRRISQGEINNLVVRYANQQDLKTSQRFYDPKIRIVPAQTKKLNPLQQAHLLDITRKFQHDNTVGGSGKTGLKKGYGLLPTVKNFGHKAGQKIRESGAIIDILCEGNPSLCRVVTLTLPASGHDAYLAIAKYSGYATNRLLQIIRRTKDDNYHWFYVWEYQKRGALHMHICIHHKDGELSKTIGDAIVSKWRDILCDISRKTGIDLLFSKGFGRRIESHEMQSINQEMQRGCGAYFSKYAAKTSHARESRGVESYTTVLSRKYPPSSFWGRSQNIVELCRVHSFSFKFEGIDGTETESLQGEALEVLSQFNILINHSFSFKKELKMKGNGSLTIAEGTTHVFYVSPSDYQHALAHIKFVFGDRQSSLIGERCKKRGVGGESYIGGDF
jgi:hypothetical protein